MLINVRDDVLFVIINIRLYTFNFDPACNVIIGEVKHIHIKRICLNSLKSQHYIQFNQNELQLETCIHIYSYTIETLK